MKIHTDSFFAIGKHHVTSCVPCQDYAHAGMLLNGIHYAGLADGCSASEDSDLGARAMIHWMRITLRRKLSSFPVTKFFGSDDIPYLVQQFVKDLGLGFLRMGVPSCMDATLNFAFLHRAFGMGFVLLAGDGAVAIKSRSQDKPRIYIVDWDQSMPPYLSYHLNDDNRHDYIKYVEEKKLMGRLTIVAEEGGMIERPLRPARQVEEGPLLLPFDVGSTDLVAVFSDGIGTFHSPLTGNQDIVQAVYDFTQFPSFTPGFVKRNYNRLMREHKKQNVDHLDDFSMAAIRIDHDASEEVATQDRAVEVKSGTHA